MAAKKTRSIPLEYGDFIDALQHARATSPDTAVPRADLPAVTSEHLGVFLRADIIREGAPGTYFLTTAEQRASVPARPAPTYTPRRVALMMAVWVAVLALPLIVWLIAR